MVSLSSSSALMQFSFDSTSNGLNRQFGEFVTATPSNSGSSRFQVSSSSSTSPLVIKDRELGTLIDTLKNPQSTQSEKDFVYEFILQNKQEILENKDPRAPLKVAVYLTLYGDIDKAVNIASQLGINSINALKEGVVVSLMRYGRLKKAVELALFINSPIDSSFINKHILPHFRHINNEDVKRKDLRTRIENYRDDLLLLEISTMFSTTETPKVKLHECIALGDVKPSRESYIAVLHCQYQDQEFLFLRPNGYHKLALRELVNHMKANNLTGDLNILGTLVLSFQSQDRLLHIRTTGGDIPVEHGNLSRVEGLLRKHFPGVEILDEMPK